MINKNKLLRYLRSLKIHCQNESNIQTQAGDFALALSYSDRAATIGVIIADVEMGKFDIEVQKEENNDDTDG